MPDLTPSVLFNRILGRVRLKHLQLAIAIADLLRGVEIKKEIEAR